MCPQTTEESRLVKFGSGSTIPPLCSARNVTPVGNLFSFLTAYRAFIAHLDNLEQPGQVGTKRRSMDPLAAAALGLAAHAGLEAQKSEARHVTWGV